MALSASRTTRSSATRRPRRSSATNGSIDWLCVPRFDSGAVLRRAARRPRQRTLADRAGRRAAARPSAATSTTRSCSRRRSTPTTASCSVTDCMPIRGKTVDIVRIVEGRLRPGPDAHGPDDPVRLRIDRPVGRPRATTGSSTRRRRARRDLPRARRSTPTAREGDRRRLRRRGGRQGAVRPGVPRVARAGRPARRTPSARSRRPRAGGASWAKQCTYDGRVARRR